MNKLKYKRGKAEATDSLEKQVAAVDNLIQSGRLVVDILQGTAAMDSYLWIYYTQDDKLMEGFCLMLRSWINFQRSWKKGELLRMLEERAFEGIAEEELKSMNEVKKYPSVMNGRVSPTPLRPDQLSSTRTTEQKQKYLEEYITHRYCLWPDAAPILVLCIDNTGQLICSVEQTTTPLSLNYQRP